MRIINLLSDGRWRTADEIAERLDMDPEDVIDFCTIWVKRKLLRADTANGERGEHIRMYRMRREDEV